MNPGKPLVSALKSVVICVASLERARPFYETLLGLRALPVYETLSDKARRLWGVPTRQVRCLRLVKPGEAFGMIDLVEIPDAPAAPAATPFREPGWVTLKLKTAHLERALAAARQLGAEALGAPQQVEVGGQLLREAVIQWRGGGATTHFVLQQCGPADAAAPLFGEAVVAAGMLVPTLAETLAFYRDTLGLTLEQPSAEVPSAWAGAGSGLSVGKRLPTARLTAGAHGPGQYEFLELPRVTSGQAVATGARQDFGRLGFWMLSLTTPDLVALQTACRHAGVSVVRGPATIDRPCFGRVQVMIVRAPGGELLECLAPASGPVRSRG